MAVLSDSLLSDAELKFFLLIVALLKLQTTENQFQSFKSIHSLYTAKSGMFIIVLFY